MLGALEMACQRRRPRQVIHHSDQGSQYTSFAFGHRCKQAGVRPSMGSVGDCYDNAMCESFFATLECELLDRQRFHTHADARMGLFSFIAGWYVKPEITRPVSRLGFFMRLPFEPHDLEPQMLLG